MAPTDALAAQRAKMHAIAVEEADACWPEPCDPDDEYYCRIHGAGFIGEEI